LGVKGVIWMSLTTELLENPRPHTQPSEGSLTELTKGIENAGSDVANLQYINIFKSE
jgi:hypothetical protein